MRGERARTAARLCTLAPVCRGETIFCQHLHWRRERWRPRQLGKSAIITLGTSPARLNLFVPSGGRCRLQMFKTVLGGIFGRRERARDFQGDKARS